jgi:hypothetical protein
VAVILVPRRQCTSLLSCPPARLLVFVLETALVRAAGRIANSLRSDHLRVAWVGELIGYGVVRRDVRRVVWGALLGSPRLMKSISDCRELARTK